MVVESRSIIYTLWAILITIRFKMSLVGNLSTCSVCGKRRIIAKQLNKVLSKQNRDNVYLECKECYRNSNLGYKYKRWKSKDI